MLYYNLTGAKMNKISNNNFIYNNNNVSFNGKKNEDKKPMEDVILNTVNKLSKRAQREMPDYGDFAPIVEKLNFNEDLKIGEPSIKIVYANYNKDKTLKRLELDVPSVSGKSRENIAMELANKETILDILSDEHLITRIKNNVLNASKAFNDAEFM